MILKPYIDPKQVRQDVTFSDVDIDSAMMNQASLFVHYGMKAASAQLQMDSAENLLEITKAKTSTRIRDEHGSVKITETKIETLVTLDEDVQKATKAYNQARMINELARHTLEAFKQRRDMLVQVGKRQAEEMLGQARVQVDADRRTNLHKLGAAANRGL